MADFIIKDVRLSFPDLFHAVEFKPGDGKPRWSASFLVEPGSTTAKQIETEIKAAALEHLGTEAKAAKFLASVAGQSNKYCYTDGNTKDYDGYEDMMVLATHRSVTLKNGGANAPPAIIDKNKAPLTAADGRPYAGCYVNAKVSIYCQTGENPGVRASFSAVQFARDGEEFGSGTPSADGFDDLGGGTDADDFS